jgi:hypothetical protein
MIFSLQLNFPVQTAGSVLRPTEIRIIHLEVVKFNRSKKMPALAAIEISPGLHYNFSSIELERVIGSEVQR